MKLLILLLLLILTPLFSHAERIERVLLPDITNAPWCEGIIFELSLEEPEAFPAPIPCYETEYVNLNASAIRTLLEQYGAKQPENEKWYNGPDNLNRRNYVFCEKNIGRYALYAYPWGMKQHPDDHPQADKLRAAADVCRAFLQEAGITGIEKPYHIIVRNHEYQAGNSLGKNPPPDEYTLSLDKRWHIDGDMYTGIGFRFELGGLPVAVQSLDDPAIENRMGTYFDCWGQMTIRDDGVITKFELWNYRSVKKELDPYTGPVCSWQEAVDAMLNTLIHHTMIPWGETEESHWLDDYAHLRVIDVEPSLAITPAGRTFPVWTITYEYKQTFNDGTDYYRSATLYVNAVTGEMAVQGEDMTL